VLAGVSAESPARGMVPEWGENGEDTTILPSAHPYTGGLGRPRNGYAHMPETPAAGRGVASVRAAAEGPSGLAAAAAAMAAAASGPHSADAPVSPAPGSAMPVSVADVEAAVAGERVAGRPIAAAVSPAAGPGVDLSSLPSGPIAGTPGSVVPGAPADNRGPGSAPGRNNRFAGAPPRSAAGAQAGPSASVSGPPPASIRPAYAGPAGPDVPSQRGGGGNPPPPPPVPPSASGGPGGHGPSHPHLRQSRRVLIVAGVVALLGLATYGWSLAASGAGAGDGPPKSLPQPSVVAATGKCVVSYAVRSDDGKRFKASVTVANRDNRPVRDWSLWFIMQGDQTVSGNGKVQLTQQGTSVTVKSPSTLNPQNAVTLDVTGRYADSNAAPMVFRLDNQTCETYVSGKPGEPSRPVQRLTNGQFTLGPPARDNPVPGITIGPGGVVTPVPLPPTTTTQPGPGTTTTTTTTPGDQTTTTTTPTATSTVVVGPPDPDQQTTTTTNPTTDPPTDPPTSTPPPPPPPVGDGDADGVGVGDE
jgi:serine/threonine-protein kinase